MYQLPLFIFVIVGAVSASIPHRDADYHAHRAEHLQRARLELQNYYDDWVHRKLRANWESMMPVTPQPQIPVPYPDWLLNPQDPLPDTKSRSQDVYASLSQTGDAYASQSHGRETYYPASQSRGEFYARQPIKDVPTHYGHGLFHLFHLHQQNGDQATWNHYEQPQQYSYSYVHGDQPGSSSCAHLPCPMTQQPYILNPPRLPSAEPVYNSQAQSVYNPYLQTQPAKQHLQDEPAFNGYQPAHHPYQHAQPGYNPYQQVQPPSDPYQQAYNGYQGTQQVYKPYRQGEPLSDPYQQAYDGYQGTQQAYKPYQQNQPAYNYQETYLDNQGHDKDPWVAHQKSPVPERPPVPPGYENIPARNPVYQYYQHNHRYPPAGPQSKPEAQELPPAVNKLILYIGNVPQQPSLVPLNTSTPASTTSQLPYEVSTTESATYAEEFTMSTTTDFVLDDTAEENFSTPSDEENNLISEIQEVANEIIAEDATKPTEGAIDYHSEATSAMPSLPTSPADEMVQVESSTIVAPTLHDVTEYGLPSTTEIEFYSSITTESPRLIFEQTTENLYSADSTKFTTKYASAELTQTNVDAYSTTGAEYLQPDISTVAHCTYEVSTEPGQLFPESTSPSTEVPEYSTVQDAKETSYLDAEPTNDKITVHDYRVTFSSATEVPVHATTAKTGITFQGTISPYAAEITITDPAHETTGLALIQETSTSKESVLATTAVGDAYSETDGYEHTVPTTEEPFYSTTMNIATAPVETVPPYGETTETYLTKATTQDHEDLGTTIAETVLSTDVPVSRAAGDMQHEPVETAPTYAINTPPLPDESTTTALPTVEETFTVLGEDETPASVTEKPSSRQSADDSLDSLPSTIPEKIKPYIKEIVRREDTWAKRRSEQQKPSLIDHNMMSDASDSNTISDALVDTSRRQVPTKSSLAAFEERFLKQLISLVIEELRQSKVSAEDKASLKEVFGDMWYRIMDAAFHDTPVTLATTDDKVAARALQYMFRGSPLARRLGKKSVDFSKGYRSKRDSRRAGRLEPWQTVILQSLLARQQANSENDDETYRLILSAIKDQLQAPVEDYDYDDEDGVSDTTEVNTSEEDGLLDTEYYDDEAIRE